MMAAHEEERAIRRVETLAMAREFAVAWAYWCIRTNVRTGYEPTLSTGGIEKNYRAPPQWHPPEPRLPDPDENLGIAVQRAFVHLPQLYRRALQVEFCIRPWIIGMREGEVETAVARKARLSVGSYDITITRALLALANVMKRKNLWR